MSLQAIDKNEINKIILTALKEDKSINKDIQSRRFYRRKEYNPEEISAVIQTNKLVQVILAMLINNQIPKISYGIACNLYDFIASDNLNAFHAVFNDVCIFCNQKKKFIKTVDLGEINSQAMEIFNALLNTDKLDSSLHYFYKWNHNYKLENLLSAAKPVFYELSSDNVDCWTAEEMENALFNNAVLQKLIVDTANHGIGAMSIAGWSLKEIDASKSFLSLNQLFEKVFFRGVLPEQEWISIELNVVSFSEQLKHYLNHEFFKRI